MAAKRNADAVARERARRARTEPLARSEPVPATRREAAATCGWCGGPVLVKAVGRIPKWCSPACRQRAWEQSRAAASGRSSVEIVERVVQLPPPPAVATSAAPATPTHGEWVPVLRELADQLDAGRIYARDLPDLATALTDVLAAYDRRSKTRTRRR
jgi:hypothetical protein